LTSNRSGRLTAYLQAILTRDGGQYGTLLQGWRLILLLRHVAWLWFIPVRRNLGMARYISPRVNHCPTAPLRIIPELRLRRHAYKTHFCMVSTSLHGFH
jgi:hypothetical protein